MMSLATAIVFALAPGMTLVNDAKVVTDLDRPAAAVRFAGVYNQKPQPALRTTAFEAYLTGHPGVTYDICVRSRATKRGALWAYVPQATEPLVKIPTEPDDAYHLNCAPFTVATQPRKGPVEISNTGVLSRTDFIRHVSIRWLATS